MDLLQEIKALVDEVESTDYSKFKGNIDEFDAARLDWMQYTLDEISFLVSKAINNQQKQFLMS